MESIMEVIVNVSGEDINIVASREEVERAMGDPAYAKELALSRRGHQEPRVVVEIGEASAVWERASVLALLTEIKDKIHDKKRVKDLYEEVTSALAELGHIFSIQQVRSKVDSLKRRYKSIKDHKGKSGNGAPPPWEFFERMDEIYGRQAWVTPRATASSSGGPSSSCGAINSQPNEPPKKRKRPEELLEGLYQKMKKEREEMLERQREEARVREEERERRKQERHNEKMALKRQFLELLSKMGTGGGANNSKE